MPDARNGLTKVDDAGFSCGRCKGTAFDLTASWQERGKWHSSIECVYCGQSRNVEWSPERKVNQDKTPGSFVLKYGRFKGQTIADVDRTDEGRDYLELLAESPGPIQEIYRQYRKSPAGC